MIIQLKRNLRSFGSLLKLEQIKHFRNYLVDSVLTKMISFISIPIFTRLLSPSDYGIAYIYESYISVLAILLIFNMNGAVSRYIYEEKDDYKEMIGTSLLFSILFLLIWFIPLIIFREGLAERMNLPAHVLWFYIPALLFSVVDSIFLQIYKAMRNSKLIMRLNFISSYSRLALVIIFVFSLTDEKYMAFFWGGLIYNVVLLVIKLFYILKHVEIRIKREHFRYIMAFAIPSMPYLLSGTILALFDRIMINDQFGNAAAGLYSFAYNIGTLQLMVSNALHNSWTPRFYSLMNRDNFEQVDRDSKHIIKVLAVAAVFLILFAVNIGEMMSAESFHSSFNFIPLIIIAHYLVGIDPLYNNFILFKKLTYIRSIIVVLATFINILGNYFLLPVYGPVAAAYTTIGAYFFIFVANIVTSKYILKVPSVSPKTILMPLVVLIFSFWIHHLFFQIDLNQILDIMIKLIVFGFLTFWLLKDVIRNYQLNKIAN